MTDEKRAEMINQEDNAVFNQVVLFVSRVIWLRCPLELSEGMESTTYNKNFDWLNFQSIQFKLI